MHRLSAQRIAANPGKLRGRKDFYYGSTTGWSFNAWC